MKRPDFPDKIPSPSLPKVCQKHVNVHAPGLCPVCLMEERDRLRREVAQYREWLGMEDEAEGK